MSIIRSLEERRVRASGAATLPAVASSGGEGGSDGGGESGGAFVAGLKRAWADISWLGVEERRVDEKLE